MRKTSVCKAGPYVLSVLSMFLWIPDGCGAGAGGPVSVKTFGRGIQTEGSIQIPVEYRETNRYATTTGWLIDGQETGRWECCYASGGRKYWEIHDGHGGIREAEYFDSKGTLITSIRNGNGFKSVIMSTGEVYGVIAYTNDRMTGSSCFWVLKEWERPGCETAMVFRSAGETGCRRYSEIDCRDRQGRRTRINWWPESGLVASVSCSKGGQERSCRFDRDGRIVSKSEQLPEFLRGESVPMPRLTGGSVVFDLMAMWSNGVTYISKEREENCKDLPFRPAK